jgi:hypothetical protein
VLLLPFAHAKWTRRWLRCQRLRQMDKWFSSSIRSIHSNSHLRCQLKMASQRLSRDDRPLPAAGVGECEANVFMKRASRHVKRARKLVLVPMSVSFRSAASPTMTVTIAILV